MCQNGELVIKNAASSRPSGNGNKQAVRNQEREKRTQQLQELHPGLLSPSRSLISYTKYIFYLNISNGYYFKLPTRSLI